MHINGNHSFKQHNNWLGVIIVVCSFLSFASINFFPLAYPDLVDGSSSEWSIILITFITFLFLLFIFMLPGISAIGYIYSMDKQIRKLFFAYPNNINNMQIINGYWLLPSLLFSLFSVLSEYLGEMQFLLSGLTLILLISGLSYYCQSTILIKPYLNHKTYFKRFGWLLLTTFIILYFILFCSINCLASIISKISWINNYEHSEFVRSGLFLLTLNVFLLPSYWLLVRHKNSKENKITLVLSVFLCAFLLLVYCGFYAPILKPILKRNHYAFFTDVNYIFNKTTCENLNYLNVKIKKMPNDTCYINEEFETTSAISNFLLLTFKQKKNVLKITIEKKHIISKFENLNAENQN